MKQVILLLLMVFLLQAEESPYTQLWDALEVRYDATVNYYRESARGYEIRKNILKTQETISTSPTIDGRANDSKWSDVSFGFGNQATWNHPRFDSYFAFSTRENRLENAQLQFLYTLKSDKDIRVRHIDSLIAMTHRKADLQREAMLFSDFQQILNYKIQYDYLLSELAARKKMAKKGEEFLDRLKKFVTAGVVPRNATQSITLFLDNNLIRVDALLLERELLLDNVSYLYDIQRSLFIGIDMDTLLSWITLSDAEKYESYTWKMDSLNAEIQRVSTHEQDMNSWKLSAGASVNFSEYASSTEIQNKLHFKFDYTFHKRDFRGYEAHRRVKRQKLPQGMDGKLEEYKKTAMAHAKNATKWIDATLERIQLGEVGIIHEISQNLDIILNQQIKYYTLKSSFYRRDIAQLRSMEQLPQAMRWQR